MGGNVFESERARRSLDRLNNSNYMLLLLFTLSFLETIVVPIPIELLLIPLLAMNRERIWTIASVAMVGCMAASVLGYGIGMALYQSVGMWFIETMGYENAYESFQNYFDQHGFVAILIVGILPIPFQIAMVSAGLSGYPILLFVLATLIARGLRYYGLAWLVNRFGSKAKELWESHALITSLALGVLVLALYFLAQFLASLVM